MSLRKRRHVRAVRLTFDSLEHRIQPAAMTPLQVALISDAVAQASLVQAAAADGVQAIVYNADTATLETLVGELKAISAATGGAPIGRLALVAHGSAASVQLGRSDTLDADDLASESPAWSSLRALFTPTARLDLYSCYTAEGAAGRSFVDALARRTGADVYASTDAVGNADGADFDWEYNSALRAGMPLFRSGALQSITGLRLEDQYEPNDDIPQTFGQPEGGEFSPNFGPVAGGKTINAVMDDNGDFYRFVTVGPGTHQHVVSIAHAANAPNLDMELRDTAGTLIAESFSSGPSDAIVLTGLSSGAYYVRVYPATIDVFGTAYSLQIDAPLDTDDDEYEDNNSIPEVASQSAGAPGSPNLGIVAGSISILGLVQDDSSQQDWFRFTTTAPSNEQHFVNIGYNNADGNVDLSLYDAGGNLLLESFSSGPIDRIDLDEQPAGTYYVRIYGADAARPAMADYDLQINAPGSRVTFASTPTVTEGDSGTVLAEFTITRSDGNGTASIDYATANATATAGLDYTPVSGTLNFGNGELSKTVSVQVIGDVIDEANETFLLKLTNPVGVVLGATQAIGTIIDDDSADVIVTPSGGSTAVTEGGASDTYSIRLASQPTADVTVTLTPGSQLTTSAPTPTFTSVNWFQAQTVTVSAIDDAVAEGTHSTAITHAASSADPRYNGIAVTDLSVTVTDNDLAAVLVVESGGNTSVSEGGLNDSYTLVLLSQPTAAVTVQLAAGSQVNVFPASLTFTPANWNFPQSVTVSAIDDSLNEGSHTALSLIPPSAPTQHTIKFPSITSPPPSSTTIPHRKFSSSRVAVRPLSLKEAPAIRSPLSSQLSRSPTWSSPFRPTAN